MPKSATFAARRRASEVALLASAIKSEHPAEVLTALEPEELSPESADLWRTCLALHREHGQLNSMLLTITPNVDGETLQRVLDWKGSTREPEKHQSAVRAASAIDKTMRMCRALLTQFEDGALDTKTVSESILRFSAHLQGLARGLDQQEGDKCLRAATEKALERITTESGVEAVTTGVPDLDLRLGGGMKPGTLTVVLGRSGHGKSSLALTAAHHAATAGKRVLYVSREMERSELAWRFAAAASDRNIGSLQEEARRYEKVRADILKGSNLPIDIDDRTGHIDAICSLIDIEHHRDRPYSLVVLDFLQIMQAEGDEQHHRLEAMAYAAKAVSMRCECAVLALAQPNRAGSKAIGLPSMHDIRGSSAIENAADSIVAVLRDDPSGESLAFRKNYPFEMTVEKARNGKPGSLEGKYWLGAGTFLVTQDQSENENVLSTEDLSERF